jgi:hypothetical protein
MSWALVGKATAFLIAAAVALAISAVVELYWPEVYEIIAEGMILVGLMWLISWRMS